jgi:hypothetical protein
LELWETRPVVKEKKNEDGTIIKELILTSDGRPEILKVIRGISRINTSDWVSKSELT